MVEETPETLPFMSMREIMRLTGKARIETVKSKIRGFSREELNAGLARLKIKMQTAAEAGSVVKNKTRLSYWLINCELTERGLPPVLRALPDTTNDDPAQIADSFAIDLFWIAKTNPKHKTQFSRWNGIFSPTQFHGAADFIAGNYPRRDLWWFVRGLALSETQQRELHIIKRDGLRRELHRLNAEREGVRIALAIAYHARDLRYKTPDYKATIDRRAKIWFVGSLADWSPQQTARLYTALTGEAVTRQLAAKIIDQVHRDLPDSKPKKQIAQKKGLYK